PYNVATGIVQIALVHNAWTNCRRAGHGRFAFEVKVLVFSAKQNVGDRALVSDIVEAKAGEPAVVPGFAAEREILKHTTYGDAGSPSRKHELIGAGASIFPVDARTGVTAGPVHHQAIPSVADPRADRDQICDEGGR